MDSPQVPAAADTAAAQTKSNIDTATAQTNLNAINQVTPTGSLTYSQNGTNADGTPKLTATTALNPAQQAILDKQTQTNSNLGTVAEDQSARLGSLLSNGIDLNSLPAAGNPSSVTGGAIQSAGPSTSGIQTSLGGDNGLQARNDAQAALMGRLQPQLTQQQNSVNQQLANQGVKIGSQAWQQAQNQLGRNQNDAGLATIANAGQEQSLQQGLATSAGNFANSAQQQGYNEQANNTGINNAAQAQQYGQNQQNFTNANTANQLGLSNTVTSQNQPLNQLLAVASGSQVSQPGFVSTPNSGVQGTDVSGITNTAYQNQLGQSNATNNAIGSIGSTVGGWLFSDEKTKTDIRSTGAKTKDGIPLKTFRYKGSPMMNLGVTAQDTQQRRPDAVRSVGGTKMVNYDKIGSPMMRLGKKVA